MSSTICTYSSLTYFYDMILLDVDMTKKLITSLIMNKITMFSTDHHPVTQNCYSEQCNLFVLLFLSFDKKETTIVFP